MGKKYAGFSDAQQKTFDGLKTEYQLYIINRVKGMNKAEAYRQCYPKGSRNAKSSANKLENRNPVIKELIGALLCQSKRAAVLDVKSEWNKKLEDKAKSASGDLSLVPNGNNYEIDTPIDVEEMSVEQAQNIKFLRDVVNGKIKSKRVTRKYDADGKLVAREEVETDDIKVRIEARKLLNIAIGVSDIPQIGQVSAGNDIKILIVDASKKDTVEQPKGDFVQEVDDDGSV